MSNPRSTAASVREQKLARVIDREVAPVWHDRFARLLLRELPTDGETFALDIHSGPGHTTAELLQRLSDNSRIVALGRDPWLMQVSKTRVRPEWKRRVYFKSGDIDDVTGMNDDTYSLTVANLVLGEQVVDWQPALAELLRVTKPGGQVLATLPMAGTWREVEDLFEEMLRDEGMRREVATLQKLRRRRPKASYLAEGLRQLGLSEHDYVVEHERFELLFRSGREFLFAPVIEHGPLRLWKAIIGRAEKPQALFWRFKETIDTYYAGHVLAVTVVAGLVRLRVPGGANGDSFAGEYWRRYPSLSRLWGAPGVEAEDDDDEFDLDIDLDEALDALTPDAPSEAAPAAEEASDGDGDGDEGELDLSSLDEGPAFEQIELSGLNELPPLDALDEDDDPFAGMLDELDAEAKAAAENAAADAEVDAKIQPRERVPSGRAATLAAVENSPLPAKLPKPPPAKPAGRKADSGASPLPGKLPGLPPASTTSESGASPLPGKLPGLPPASTASESGVRRTVARAGESGVRRKVARAGESGVRRAVKTPSQPTPRASESGVHRGSESGLSPLPGKLPPKPTGQPKLPPIAKKKKLGKLSDRLPRRASSSMTAIPKDFGGGASAKPAVSKPAVNKPSTPKPSAGTSGRAKPPPAPSVTKPGEEDPFASMLEDDDDLDEIDELELDDDSLIDGQLDEDDDLEAAFGNLKPETNVGPPPPPPKKK